MGFPMDLYLNKSDSEDGKTRDRTVQSLMSFLLLGES